MSPATCSLCLVVFAAPLPQEAPASTPLPVVQTAAELGISAEALIVCGLQGYAETILARIEAAAPVRLQLAIQHAAIDAAASNVAAIESQLRISPTDVAAANQSGTASIALANAQAQLDGIRSALLQQITVELPSAGVQALAIWNSAGVAQVSPEFRVKERAEGEWKAIEGALRAERRALRRGQALAPQHAALLQSLRSDVDVIAASLRLGQHLAAVEDAFEMYEVESSDLNP